MINFLTFVTWLHPSFYIINEFLKNFFFRYVVVKDQSPDDSPGQVFPNDTLVSFQEVKIKPDVSDQFE